MYILQKKAQISVNVFTDYFQYLAGFNLTFQ